MGAGLATLLWAALATEPGARWLFSRLGGIMPGELEVAELEGPIRGPLTVRGLRYANDSMEVTVERLYLEWRLSELLARRLDVHRLEAEGIDVLTLPGPETPERSPLPDVNLRFNVVVRDARLRGLAIRSVAEVGELPPEPFVIDSIDLATTARGGLVEVEHLSVRSPDLDLEAKGTLRPQGAYDVDLDARWAYRAEGMRPFSGRGTLVGTLEELRVRQELAEPFAIRLDALLRDPLYDLSFRAELEADGVATRTLDPAWPAVTGDARLVAEGTLEELTLRGTVDADTADYGPWRAGFDLTRDGRRIAVRELVATRPGAATRVSAQGSLTLPDDAAGEALAFDLVAAWTDLAWPLTGPPTVSSARGEAAVAGTAEGYRLSATAAVAAGALAPLGPLDDWTAEGRGDSRSFELETLAGGLLGGRLTGAGRVRWEPRVEWSLDLSGRGIDPSVLAADYPGSLDFRAVTAGHLEEAGPVGQVELASLSGTLRGQPVSARGTVELAGGVYRLDPLQVTWAEDRLEASGALGERYDLTLHLEAPNLAVALAGAAGFLEADATVTGPSAAPRIALTARGRSLTLGDRRAAELDLAADVDLSAGGPVDVELRATGVDLGDLRAERITFDADGTRDAHTLALDLFADGAAPATASLVLAGGLEPRGELAWRGRIERLEVDADRVSGLGRGTETALPQLGTWRLERPAGLVASREAVALDGFCWAGRGRVCGEGSWRSAGGWNADATLAGVPLALASSFLPPGVEITGDLDGTVTAGADAAGRLSGSLRLTPGPGELVYPASSDGRQRLRYERGTVTAVAGADGVAADLGLVLVDVGQIDGHLELPGYGLAGAPPESQELQGRLSVHLADLSLLQALVDAVSGVGGRLDAELTLAGTRAAPEVRGEAVLADARLDVPEYGLELRDIRLTARGVGREPITLEGSVRSGDGTLTLAGEVPLAPSAEAPARLTARGRGFEAIDTPEIRALASPDLTLTYDGSVAEVTGEVRVPEAKVEIAKRSEGGAVPVSDDVVFVGPDAAEGTEAGGAEIAARVRVILGADVEVDVLGLHAEPTGSLLLVQRPGRLAEATGELGLAGGTFKAYGQDLTIERGRLVFAGPVTDPGIDLRAFRKADDGVVAGLEARGTLRRPEVTLWSKPPMAQSAQLSYILLGRPLGQATESEGNLLANAATTLGIKGGNLLGKRLAARYGLEEVRIETTGSLDQASLVLGKYLSPRLFVGYGLGLFEAVNTIRIRYLLSDQLTLEAQRGVGTSADLLYTLERGEGAEREAPPGTVREALEERREAPPEGGRGGDSGSGGPSPPSSP